jgi:hypothetical protein
MTVIPSSTAAHYLVAMGRDGAGWTWRCACLGRSQPWPTKKAARANFVAHVHRMQVRHQRQTGSVDGLSGT